MIKFDITNSFFYRWRYYIGYGTVAIGLITVLILASLYTPGGITTQEMNSVVTSNSIKPLSISTYAITNLPYHILQKISIAAFGVSILSIKLPSIILAFLSAVGMIVLLRNWFKPNVGVLASLIAITTGQYLFIAQDGTPNILYLFWSVGLLLFAHLISTQQDYKVLYKVCFGIFAALSLYTPLSIYTLIALGCAALFHPHLRFVVKQFAKSRILIGLGCGLLMLIPLFIAIFKNPSLILSLLGISTSWPDLGANLSSLGAQYFGFTKPGGTTIMTPFFELGSMLIIAIGIYSVIKNRVTAKSYIIAFWIICLAPIIVLNPNFTSITFLPLVLLLASGLNKLLTHWYDLFPRNPYARISGLVPIIILVTVLVFSGADRYINGYRYDPNIAPNFSKDLSLIPKGTTKIIVSKNELPFYQVYAKYNKKVLVSTTPDGNSFLATKAAKQIINGYRIDKVYTSSRTNDGDRFYSYIK